jgi:SSS family transporter
LSLPLSAVVVLALYVAGITAFGTWLGRRGRSVKDYFLGGRRVPWWAIAACIVATETSTLTFIGAPGTAYNGNWTFLQLVLGYVVGRFAIAALFIPAYFRGELYTSYELLQNRFGSAVRGTSSAIFLLYRTLGDGIRLYAAALVIAVAASVPVWWCIVLLGAAMIVYTEEGGVTATIWTDTIQMFVYLAGALVCLVTVAQLVPGGVSGALAAAGAAGKTRVLDFSFDPTTPFTFWAGLIGGGFLTLATHGTDHYLVQRLLVARSQRDAAIGLTLSGFLVLAQFVMFMALGTLLWTYYGGRAFESGDKVLPTFVSEALPGPLVGFILAAVVAAALSPSLNSMASATVRDFYLPYFNPAATDRQQMRVGRFFTVVWGVLQMGVAVAAQGTASALQSGLAALSYASGPIVGAFLLGVLTKTATSPGTMIGMIGGLAVSLAVGTLPRTLAPAYAAWPGVAWTWNVAVGAILTFVIGLAAGRAVPRTEPAS